MEASMEIQEALENDVQNASVVQETVPVRSQKRGIAAPKKRRVKLLLVPRTKPMEPSVSTPTNPVFGGAKPVDTAAKDKEIEERINRENGTIPKYPKVKREVRKCTSSVIGKSFRLSSNLYKNDNRLVPCCKPPILKKQHDCVLHQQCNTLQNKNNGGYKKTKKKQLAKEKQSSRFNHLSADSKGDRDSRTLWIGTLPKDITPTEVLSLSNDIKYVIFPRIKNKNKRKFIHAFTEFVSETEAEKNYKILKRKKLRGQPITVNYAGHKSQNQKGEPVPDFQNRNMKVLRAPKLPIDTTVDKVASMFPEAFQIQIHKNSAFRSARINFQTEKLAAEAMTASKDFKINGLPVRVLYSKKRRQQKKKKRGKKSKGKNQQNEENKKNKLKHRKKLQKIKQKRKHRTNKKVKLEIKKEGEDHNQPQKKIKMEIKEEGEDYNQPQKKIKLEIKQENKDEE